jgi:hypothetical protein
MVLIYSIITDRECMNCVRKVQTSVLSDLAFAPNSSCGFLRHIPHIIRFLLLLIPIRITQHETFKGYIVSIGVTKMYVQ